MVPQGVAAQAMRVGDPISGQIRGSVDSGFFCWIYLPLVLIVVIVLIRLSYYLVAPDYVD
jgi:hypothetical protein